MKLIKKSMAVLLGMGVVCAQAQDLPVFTDTPMPVFFDDKPEPLVHHDETWQGVGERVVSSTFTMPDISKLNANELQEVNLIYAEELISMAVVGQNWDILQELLEIYQTMPEFDGILTEYATGAMLRKQGNQKGAIAKYKSILAKNPNLSYVKLDLALMLIENKQFKDADVLLAELESSPISSVVLAVVEQVRSDVKKHGQYKPSVSFNYESTNNVNNASSEKVITWLGKEWQKDEDSLPKEAHGVRYGVGVSKEHNVGGNHNIVANGNVSGVAYWDNKDYNERTLRASLGYKYADIAKVWRFVPFAEQNWLGGARYNQNIGVSLGYGRAIGDKSYAQLSASYAKKRYKEEAIARRHDGEVVGVGMNVSHKIDKDTLIYGGIDTNIDKTKDKELASVRYGIRGGVVQEFDNGMGLNASLRYAQREFDAPSKLVYTFVRQDKEYQATLGLWHKKIVWQGLRPEANIRYTKIDSNMPAFYSRDGLSYFMSVEKTF